MPILDATLAGERQAITDQALLGQVLRMPWMTLKVVAGIHWEAILLILKGLRLRSGHVPAAPVTVGRPVPATH